jgi:hypothetical protein
VALVNDTQRVLDEVALAYTAFVVCASAVTFAQYLADPHRYYSLTQLIGDLLVLYPLIGVMPYS